MAPSVPQHGVHLLVMIITEAQCMPSTAQQLAKLQSVINTAQRAVLEPDLSQKLPVQHVWLVQNTGADAHAHVLYYQTITLYKLLPDLNCGTACVQGLACRMQLASDCYLKHLNSRRADTEVDVSLRKCQLGPNRTTCTVPCVTIKLYNAET